MKKIAAALAVFVLMLCIATPVFSDGVNSKTYPLTSDLYELMDDLYALEGLSRPSTSRPWSQSEAQLILSRIDQNSLNAVEKDIYSRIQDIVSGTLRWDMGDYALGAYIDVALEAYAHSNTQDFVTDADWVRGFEKRLPLAKLSMDFSIKDYFYTYCDIQYGWGRVSKGDKFYGLDLLGNGYTSDDGYVGSYQMDDGAHMMVWSEQYSKAFAHSVLPASAYFDFIWPKRAIFALGGESWSFQYGRDRIAIGNASIGNMLVDDHTDFNDYLSATFYTDGFKYQWINIFLNGITDNGEARTDDTRIYMIHTLEFRPMKSLSFIVSEDVMFKMASDNGSAQVLDLSFLNPSFIWHNLNNRSMFNAIAYGEVNWVPAKGMEVYGQFALDQARAPNEDDSQGDAWGMVAGFKYTTTAGPGVARLYAEFAHTTPLLYRRDEVDFIKCSRYFHFAGEVDPSDPFTVHRGSNALVFEFIGFPYGGDCQTLELGGVYTIPGSLKVTAYSRLYQHGQFTMYTPHNLSGNNASVPNYKNGTPSGDVITRAVLLSSNVSYDMQKVFGWMGVTLEAELDWVGKWDYTKSTKTYSNAKSDFQFSISVDVKL